MNYSYPPTHANDEQEAYDAAGRYLEVTPPKLLDTVQSSALLPVLVSAFVAGWYAQKRAADPTTNPRT